MKAAITRIRPWDVPDVLDPVRPPPPGPAPPAPVKAPPPEVAPPSFTAADLAAACEQGRRDGAALAGQTDAGRAVRALEEIAAGVRAGADAAAGVAQRHATAIAELVLQALVTAFPVLEARLGPAEAASLVEAVLPGLSREPSVLVRVAPGGADAIAAQLAHLPAPQRGKVTIETDPALGDADARVIWRDGEAIRDGAAIRNGVLAALGRLLDGAATEGSEP